MKDNDTLRNMLIAGAVFVTLMMVSQRFFPPPRPGPAPGPTQFDPDTAASGRSTTSPSAPGRASPRVADGAAGNADFVVIEADQAQTRVLGSREFFGNGKMAAASPYRMRLTTSSVGASVETATITDHAETLGSDERYRLLSAVERPGATPFRSLAIEKINIDGVDVILHDKVWHAGEVIETRDGQRVEFSIDIHRDGSPVLRLTRTLYLPSQPVDLGRHDLVARVSMENVSSDSHEVILAYRGGVGVKMTQVARMEDRYIDWGTSDGTRVTGDRTTFPQISKTGDLVPLFVPVRAAPDNRLLWAATANTYFTCTIAPRGQEGGSGADHLARVEAIDLDGLPMTDDDVTIRFVTRARTLAAGEEVAYSADVYIGEKDGDAFRALEPYAARNYYYQVAQSYGWCTFTFLVEMMIWLLNGIYALTHDYAIGIIVLVLIVRTVLHPITKKGQVNMVRMQTKMGEFAPKLEELKKKYGGDKVRMQQEQMKLYREEGINPAGQILNCLPMFLQMPIWVALFFSLSNNIGMRHQPFHFTWITDLTAMDCLYEFSTPIIIPLLGWKITCFNLLPILVAVFMYTQQKLQPKPKPNPNATEQQKQQMEMMQKMAPMMSIMMLVIFYNMPAGLNLYIMCSSLFGTIEQHRIRKHIKEQEEAGTLLKPVKKRPSEELDSTGRKKLSFFEKLQKMADQAQKPQAASHRSGKTKPKR